MYTLEIRRQAYDMLDEAYLWYEQQMSGLGEQLLKEVDERFNDLVKNPQYYSFLTGNYRHVLLRRFPFKVVFEIHGKKVVVYAILHTSRNDLKFM